MAQYYVPLHTTLFMPSGELEGLSAYFDCIPHYLFRTSSPRSSGTTTDTCVTSSAIRYGIDQSDILGRDREEAAEMLKNHLLWKSCTPDNLMSWTNSFLFAVQHAIWREETDRPASPPEKIYITSLDTRKTPRGAFLPATVLLEAFNIGSTGKLRHEYYHGEYLSQGTLSSNAIITTTLAELIDHGLYKLYPPFAEVRERDRLFLRVQQLRETFTETPEVPTDEEINNAQWLSAVCFI
ncbi:hypothetical protein PtrSN002B_000889 [Pyrenophora tritici-repentis]|uniref:DUF7587 domain-containing protein n=2 Tax=Pyrenophora tritici-repentis TaxID=45151 RepID=A0A2W1DPQ8_9PLEO|nr:uncharacterized protein PTRG_04621 [Pyrenophora tritici-repentis Pt-1C-BFP]KAA8612620.1 hypothetical protein PtrV1_13189 [Pyrenophora tritici-repentis]EDU47528.1 conserved hypothetical protein [Pyrenophora tritici-repentis Pt-1C-BFP]KAF7446842.1 hypothetical protein A1F99_082890 [Pyrenophora tritici-repentis]KAF7569117.1 hypothetical protein PtrM4_115320 [Pyrenophora tritici-repentis]KAG9383082.1 hypothetical protein A1F94_007003 [Pyrenophora tritici-repentis]